MRPFANSPVWKIIDYLGEKTSINPANVKPIFSLALFHADPNATAKPGQPPTGVDPKPGLRAHMVWLGNEVCGPAFTLWYMPKFSTHGDSLFYNAPIFIRVMWPFVGIMIRWSGSSTKRAYFQCGIGWKLNGRFAPIFRFQSDPSAAIGMDAPNPDQGFGWAYRGK
jgi:hypothetical protein